MKHLLFRLLASACLLVAPAAALPAVQHITIGNVTSNGACVAWDFSESARPGLEVFTDAAATQNVTTSVRIEIQSLENARREVTSTTATRAANRALQATMATKKVAFVRLSGLAPQTQYYVRPQALNAATDSVLATGVLTPFTTATSAVFAPESRQLIADLAAVVPTSGDVSGVLLIASHAQAAYPLIAVIGDGVSSTAAYFDLTLLLNTASGINLLPPAGPLALSLSWLGLPEIDGVFQPDTVPFTGATTVAAATYTAFVGQGFVVHATPSQATAIAGIPLTLNFSVTDVGNVVTPTFNRPLIVEGAALSTGVGTTVPLSSGVLNNHLLVFSAAGRQTLTVRDSGSNAFTTIQINVLSMSYQNWRNHYLGTSLATGATGANPDSDPYPNFIEYLHGLDPNGRDGSILGASRGTDKALTIRFDLNPLQREYQVVIQVSPNLNAWQRSNKVPQLVQAFPDYNVMEVSWSEAELLAETGVTSSGYFARLAWEPATSFNSWLTAYSLTGFAADATANPDSDDDPNYVEFALDSNPNSGLNSGKVRETLVYSGATFIQVLTVPMRLGTVSVGGDPAGGELVFEVENVRYRIQGSINLTSWTLNMEEIPAASAEMPSLSPGYEYRSFRNSDGGPLSSEFLRVRVEHLQPVTSFNSWRTAYSLTGLAAAATANPDGDEDPNFVEFALDSNPTSGVNSGKVRELVSNNGGTLTQTLTLPMRLGAVHASGDPAGGELVFEVDGLRYRIQGSTNLVFWTLNMVEVPAASAGMPALNTGYVYRSFRNSGIASLSSEFLRVRIEQL